MLCPYCLAKDHIDTADFRIDDAYHNHQANYSCPDCQQTIPRKYVQIYDQSPPVVLNAVGFRGHGKTVYFAALFHALDLLSHTDNWRDFYYMAIGQDSLDVVQANVNHLEQGELPPSTPKNFPHPTLIQLSQLPLLRDSTLLCYDTGGESFQNVTDIGQYAQFIRRANTILFFVSVMELANPGREMHRLLNIVTEGLVDLGVNARQTRLVVVYTKGDEMQTLLTDDWQDLNAYLNNGSIERMSRPEDYLKEMKQVSRRLEAFTRQSLKARTFCNALKNEFLSTEYCLISALGAKPDGDRLQGQPVLRRVMDPLIWLLYLSQPVDDYPQTSVKPKSQAPVHTSAPTTVAGLTLQTFSFEVISLDQKGKEAKRQPGQARYFREDLGNGVYMDMVYIPGGTFTIGSPQGEATHNERENQKENIKIAPFFMSKYPVTQAQWRAVARQNLEKARPPATLWGKLTQKVTSTVSALPADPSNFKGADRPVELITWHQAVQFCKKLSALTGRAYRLPGEAQWEYACRAGTSTPFHFGPTISPAYVNYNGSHPYGQADKGQYRQETVAVTELAYPNAFGLYHMHGNVRDWCADNWHGSYTDLKSDGSWASDGDGSARVLRGGSWHAYGLCRSAGRSDYSPDYRIGNVGCRLVFVP